MKIEKWKKTCLGLPILMLAALLLGPLRCANTALAETYGDSAHGDATGGVNRSTATCENWPGGQCVTGSCAHCHDTFDPGICGNDPNGLMLFASNENPGSQTDNFCFQCHEGAGCLQAGGITNHTYSTNFGGGAATFATIDDAFNPATGDSPSSHNLADLLNHGAGMGVGITSDTNACIVCHDQHGAQQNYPVTLSGLGGVLTAIRRPIDYPGPLAPTNPWGDESGERMVDFSAKYQAPFRADSGYEPDGATDEPLDGWGSNVPDYINFCRDCHKDSVQSSEHGTLTNIQWGSGADQHGRRHDDGGMGYTLPPYGDSSENYVLSCTDCHESHGSENEWLLRTCVNGKDGITIPATGKGKWWDFCTACHVLTNGTTMYHKPEPTSPNGCPHCHYHGHVHF
ncbi:MAG: hypothetical protein SWQ30_22645 [Thermodesulfobacteriota bacterium]|nr:hypothetical protein [Thermodesulfobacteriota bacterium]